MSTAADHVGPFIPEWTLADRLRKARQIAGMGQSEFSREIQVKEGTYAQWEAGNSKPRDIVAVAKRIELKTGVSAGWLLGIEVAPTGPNDGGPGGQSKRHLGGSEWAPRGSNPEPTDSTKPQISGVVIPFPKVA